MSFKQFLQEEQQKEYFIKLQKFIDDRYKITDVYPKKENIYKAFDLTPFEKTKVVILGQDPYHQKDQAQGLAFSTPKEIKNPPSMVNILKEIESEFGQNSICHDGDLTPWSKQGVLLINTILTVEDSKPKSHEKSGWETFTNNIIKYLSSNYSNIIFILWGSNAIKKSKFINEENHFILTAPHPSPLSSYRGFFGCNHFLKTNDILKSIGKDPIDW